MNEIIIYSKPVCPYCDRAKNFFKSKNLAYNDIDISGNSSALEEMLVKSGGRKTVPQIFVNGTHVGGCDDMMELDREGKFELLLKK